MMTSCHQSFWVGQLFSELTGLELPLLEVSGIPKDCTLKMQPKFNID